MLRWLSIAATAAMIAVNGLANALPINGKTTGEISDGFDILFTPAGYVFSIWGLIYLALTAFAIAQALAPLRDSPVLEAIRPWYLLNTAANAGWIFAWHHEQFFLTWVLMLVILTSLVVIYGKTATVTPSDTAHHLLVRVPFSLYLGWISIATIANTTVVLWEAGLSSALSDPVWTLAILLVATAICAVVSLRFFDPVYAAVFVWAFVGIALEHAETTLMFAGALTLAGACALLGGVSIAAVARRDRSTRPTPRE